MSIDPDALTARALVLGRELGDLYLQSVSMLEAQQKLSARMDEIQNELQRIYDLLKEDADLDWR